MHLTSDPVKKRSNTMAGTRLTIQALVVLQYTFLLGLGITFGLKSDLVLAPFHQSGRWALYWADDDLPPQQVVDDISSPSLFPSLRIQVIVERNLKVDLSELTASLRKVSAYPCYREPPEIRLSHDLTDDYLWQTKAAVAIHLQTSLSNNKAKTTSSSLYLPVLFNATDDVPALVQTWLTAECLQPAPNSKGNALDAFYQRAIPGRYNSLLNRLKYVRKFVLKESFKIPMGADIAEQWFLARHLLLSQQAAQDDNDAWRLLEEVDVVLSDLERNPKLLTPPEALPMDQTAAVFAPLVIPTLLPLFIGLVREYKRYRGKQHAQS